jgi:hypothetical protein
VAREFKRQLNNNQQIVLGGKRYSGVELMAASRRFGMCLTVSPEQRANPHSQLC